MPKLYIISGCNGAGKTTASYTLLPEMLECSQFVNSDEFAKGLSPFNPEQASIQASRYMLLKIRYLFARKEDFGIETTLATRTLLKMVSMAQKEGYTVTLMYFWLNSPDLAVARVKARERPSAEDTAWGSAISSRIICRCATAGYLQTTPKYLSGSLPKAAKTTSSI